MELPKIFSKLTTTQDNSRETFLALEIAPETVKSAVWAVEGKKTVVIKIGSVEEWEEDKEDSLIEAVDRSISNAGEGLSPEPNKVILGLLSSWVKDDQIAENRRALLKNVCSKLELKPLGFVVNLEALIAHIKEEEGTPVSAIFINLSETQSLISLVQLGKLKGTHAVGRSEDLAADVREGLARFGEIENLPSRMILFDGIADFEEAKQQLMSFDWQKYLKFIHFPKVESLEVAASIKAVAIAGGAEVAKSLGFTIAEEKTAHKEEKTIATEKAREAIAGSTETEIETELTADDLGFISEKDIAHLKKTTSQDESLLEKPTKDSTLGGNTDKQVEPKESTALETVAEEAPKRKPFHLQRPVPPVKKSLSLLLKPFSAVGQFLSQRKISVVIVPLIFLAVIAALGFAFYWYVPKATVTLYFKPQVLEKEFSIEKIQKSGAVFNAKKMEWINGYFIRQKPLNELAELCLPYLAKAGLVEKGIENKKQISKMVALYHERLKKLSEIPELIDFFFKENLDYEKELLIWKIATENEIASSLDRLLDIISNIKEGDWTKEKLSEIIMPKAEELNDRGKMLWPMRAALSGKQASAGPFEIAEVLGREKTIKRIKKALEIIRK